MILIIDSEKIAESKIKQSFNELGFESILVTKTAQQARDIMLSNESSNSQDDITLIIISNQLDDADEFEFCREIKKTQFGKDIYTIVLVSSIENKTAIEKARLSGASDFSVKPYHTKKFQQHFLPYLREKVVMLIEDDPVIRKMVRRILSRHQVEIIEIDDGLRAYNLFKTMLPTRLVLMDIGLPNMNGIHLVEHIRAKPHWKKTPVVMLTSSSDVENVKKSLGAGANDYITKPFNITDFISRLSRHLPDAS